MTTKCIFLGLFLVVAGSSIAQEYKSLKFGIGGGLNVPRNSIVMYLEPMWRLSDAVALGFRDEVTGGKDVFIFSATLNGQWYLSQSNLRPFVGMGLGYYSLSTDALGVIGKWSFGAYPRVGFDFGHLTFTVDYNWIAQQLPEEVTLLGVPTGQTTDRTASYLCVKVGFAFGGGRRNEAVTK